MRIGIDIDDVLTDTSPKVKEYLYKYEKSGDGIKYISEVMRGEMPTENIKRFFDQYVEEIYQKISIKSDAAEVLQRLSQSGHEIIFITARGEQRFKGSEKTTINFFKEFNIQYKEIIFNSFEKQVDCKKNNIDIMIDDSVKNCELVDREGIKSILYTSDVNKDDKTNVERVENWVELENIINNYEKTNRV